MPLLQISRLWFGLILVVAASNVGAKETALVFHRPDFDEKGLDSLTVIPAGEIELAGGIKIPAFGLAMWSGRQEEKETFRPEAATLDIRIKPELASHLYAYAYPNGIILAPKGWKVWSAGLGADASMVLLFAPDTSGRNYLLYSNTGVCLGCAISEGSLYFDEARKMAQEDEFEYYRPPSFLKMVRLNQFEKAYSIHVKRGNPIDGLAHFKGGDDLPFFDVQISMGRENHELATVLLNQFRVSKNRN